MLCSRSPSSPGTQPLRHLRPPPPTAAGRASCGSRSPPCPDLPLPLPGLHTRLNTQKAKSNGYRRALAVGGSRQTQRSPRTPSGQEGCWPRVQAGAGQIRPASGTEIAQRGTAGLREPGSCRWTQSPRVAEQALAGPAPGARAARGSTRVTAMPRGSNRPMPSDSPKLPLSQRRLCPMGLPSAELSGVGQPHATAQPTERGQSSHKALDGRHQVPGNRKEQ